MSPTTKVWRTDANTSASPTLLFIHGYLDSANVWNDLVEALGDSVNVIR
jgi:pimeloyl-ACP methyl ester carboxylesterase